MSSFAINAQEKKDTTNVKPNAVSDTLRYPFNNKKVGGLYLENPRSFQQKVEYDTKNSYYKFTNKVGNYNITHPYLMNRKEYSDYVLNKSMRDYFRQKSDAMDPKKNKNGEGAGNLLPQFMVNSKFFETVFGGNSIEIIPQGFASLDLGMLYQRIENPQIPEENRSSWNFDFSQRIQLSVMGNIGKKLKLQTNYDTQATFDFQNQMKLEFTGSDDDIVKKIEMGNVSLPVNSSLIQGAQSLFGVKTKLQFGKTTITGVFSEQKSQTKTVTSEGGATVNEFELFIDDYDANRHYFLSQYFYEHYDEALAQLPFINSRINITRIEVWLTNKRNETENVRNIVGFMDLGENKPSNNPNVTVYGGDLPDNSVNSLDPRKLPNGIRDIASVSSSMNGFQEAVDYTVLQNARKLNYNEYTFDERLGYISLNQSLNTDEILAVAFQYTYNGKTYQVGEFSNDGIESPENIVVKLLKSTITNVKLPIWDLMMKNIYSMGAYQVSSEDFRMDILYANDNTGVPLNYLSDSPIKDKVLLNVFNLDALNKNGDPHPDGYFDYMNGVTIDSKNGKIIFPSAQPFGSYLEKKLRGDADAIKKYVYTELYENTKFVAQQQTSKNKFMLKGKYKGEGGGGIPLGAINVPRGSVKVTSGGGTLTEGVDYTVDYQLGRVKIINESIVASGAPVSVSLENNSTFSLQTRRFMGVNVEHKFNDNFVLDGNIINLREKPLTQKVSYGVEPVNNTVYGLGATYSDEAPFLSDFASMISFANKRVKSNVSVRGEVAFLSPGSPSGITVTGESTSYIDDFEASQIFLDVKGITQWKMASTPQMFSADATVDGLDYSRNRAKMAWYIIDPSFYGNSYLTPSHIDKDKKQVSENNVRRVYIDEVFPETQVPVGNPTVVSMFDLAYYPNERGMYNFDTNVNTDGTLTNPEDRWGGIMRSLTTSNFEEANIEYIHIWMMDPFAEDVDNKGGDLYFNLGSVSEDVLRDGRKSFENGLPSDGSLNDVIETKWGYVPSGQSLLYSFDNDDNSVLAQDIGYDGMNNNKEGKFYASFLNELKGKLSTEAYAKLNNDPAGDDFHHFRGSDYDNSKTSILHRYKRFNNVEGNSVPASKSPESYPTSATTMPDIEDLNRDQTMGRSEAYFQYKIEVRPGKMIVGENNLVDERSSTVKTPDGKSKTVKWYQFKIPVSEPIETVGGIADFRSIRFMRLFMTGFEKETVLRFAKFEFIRGDWRRYTQGLESADKELSGKFDISAVSLEENSNRFPIPYVLPPGIDREQLFNQTQVQDQNEQSLSLKVCDLEDGKGRAAFKNVSYDLRRYKRLKMFAHLEDSDPSQLLKTGDVNLIVRMGSDFSDNYYQYEIPLKPTPHSSTSVDAIWPEVNELNMPFSLWEDIKLARNSAKGDISKLFTRKDGNNFVSIKGNPNMANIRTVVIGVKNVSGYDNQCAEVWVNELRLAEFDNRGGWAATTTMNANLADLADFTLSGSMSSVGFGSIDKGVTERANEDVKQYNLSTNINMGKFAPKKWGLNIPVYYTQTETFKDPEYDPLNPDITFSKSVGNLVTDEAKSERVKMAQDYTKRTSFSLSNVKKERVGKKKPKLYDVENLSFSYLESKTYHSDITTDYFIDDTYKGGFQYNFNSKPKSVEPFKKWSFVKKSNWLDLVEKFNFYYLPSKLSFESDLSRRYNTEKFRNIENPLFKIEPMYNKNMLLNYAYAITFDLTKNLKLDLSSRSSNIIDEPYGEIDTQAERDTIYDNIKSMGRPSNFHQRFNLGYKLPLKYIPALKWIDVNAKYSADFDWQAGSMATRTADLNLGNSLQNSNTIQLNGKMNFKRLYRSLGIGKKSKGKSTRSSSPPSPTSKKSTKKKSSFWDIPVGLVTMLKDVKVSYSENNGTFMPGYLPEVGFFGQDKYNGGMAPSVGFMFGDQTDLRHDAVLNGWLTTDTKLNNLYTNTHVVKFDVRSTIEPIKDFKIDLSANRNFSSNHAELFKYVTEEVDTPGFYSQNPISGGNFNMTFYALPTSFNTSNDNLSETFETLKSNRIVIANRLAKDYYGSATVPINSETNYPVGYESNNQEVLIASFLSAYSGEDANKASTDAIRSIPLPNWRVTYNGLMNIPWVKSNFENITISHAYSSSYSINNYSTNLNYQPGVMDLSDNFYGEYIYGNVNMVEQFSPLVRLDFGLSKTISFKSEIKKDRTVNLSLNNNMITEVLGDEYILGFGYRIKDLKFKIKTKGRRKTLKSDMNIKVDFSYRTNRTYIRDLGVDDTQITGGQDIMSLRSSVDYALSKRLTMKLYYEQNMAKYALSTAFPTSNVRFGFNAKFNLGN